MVINNVRNFVSTAVANVQSVANKAIGNVKENWPTFKFEALTKLSSIKDSMVENFGKLTRSVVKRFNPDAGARMSMEYHAKKLEKNFSSVGWESQEKVGQALSSLSNDQNLSTEAKTKILKTLDKKFAKELLAKSDLNTNKKLETIANRLSNEIKIQSIVVKNDENKAIYENEDIQKFIDTHRTPETFVNAFFDQNGQFTTPDDIKDAKAFFNPTTFTTEERATIVEQLKSKASSAQGSNKVLINTMISSFENNTTLDSIINLSKTITDENRTSIDQLRTPENFVKALFDQNNGQFTTPDDIKAARNFFNPTTFTTEERTTIVELLKEKKQQIGNASTSPKTMEELNNVNPEKQINRLKIDMMIAQFTEPWDVAISQQNKVYNTLIGEVISYVEGNTKEGTNTLNRQKLEEMQSNVDTITKIYNTFLTENYDNNGPIDNTKIICVAQVLPRLNLFAKDILKHIEDKNNDYLSVILKEMKQVRVDEQYAEKVVFIAKKCSEFMENNKGKTESDFFTKTIKEYETNLNNINISAVSNLTKTNASAVTQLAQALGYQESQ